MIEDDDDLPHVPYTYPPHGYDWEPDAHAYPHKRFDYTPPAELMLTIAKAAWDQEEIRETMKISIAYWEKYGGYNESGSFRNLPGLGLDMIHRFHIGYLLKNGIESKYSAMGDWLISRLILLWSLGKIAVHDDTSSTRYLEDFSQWDSAR